MNKIEQLLQPRYMVIAPWPGCSLLKDDILIKCKETDLHFNRENDTHIAFVHRTIVTNPEKYPSNLRLMHWSEGRTVEEMPEYVKDVFRPGMVNNIFVYKVKHHFKRDCTSIDGHLRDDKKYWVDENDFSHTYKHYEPATEEQYLEYINSKQ